MRICCTLYRLTRVSHLATEETISFPSGVAFAVVIRLGGNVSKSNTLCIGVAVVLFARVDYITSEPIAKVSGVTFATVIHFISDNSRNTLCVGRAAAVVFSARVGWNTFWRRSISNIFEPGSADTFEPSLTNVEWNTVGVGWTDSVVATVIAGVTVSVAVADKVFVADTVVAVVEIDASGVGGTRRFPSGTFVHFTNNCFVIPSQPRLPLSSVGRRAHVEHVVEQRFHPVEQILSRADVMKVDQVTRDSTILRSTLCPVPVILFIAQV